jgi:prophage DNA circulation protein
VSDVFLGVIAAAVLVMAAVQVAVVVMAARTAKSITRLTTQLEQDIRPLVANLHSITTEAARATAIAAAQVERADRLFTDMSARLDHTLNTVQHAVVGVTRGGAWVAGIKAALSAFRDLRSAPRRRAASVEEEDALFIG